MAVVARSRTHRTSIWAHLSARQIGTLYAATLLTFAGLLVAHWASAGFSELLAAWQWTNGSHGPVYFDSWPVAALALGVGALGLFFLQYGLVFLGWRILRGRLRVRPKRVALGWLRAAMLAPVAIGILTFVVDAVVMLVTRVGWVHAPTGTIICFAYYLIVPAQVLRSSVRRRARAIRPNCRVCGYNLTGNVSGVCPECGNPVPQTRMAVPKGNVGHGG